jgi:hypothetical protein
MNKIIFFLIFSTLITACQTQIQNKKGKYPTKISLLSIQKGYDKVKFEFYKQNWFVKGILLDSHISQRPNLRLCDLGVMDEFCRIRETDTSFLIRLKSSLRDSLVEEDSFFLYQVELSKKDSFSIIGYFYPPSRRLNEPIIDNQKELEIIMKNYITEHPDSINQWLVEKYKSNF